MSYFIVEKQDRGGPRRLPGEYETREQAEAALAKLLDDYEHEHGPEARPGYEDVLVIVNT